jgi:hypothetical protein
MPLIALASEKPGQPRAIVIGQQIKNRAIDPEESELGIAPELRNGRQRDRAHLRCCCRAGPDARRDRRGDGREIRTVA